MKNDETQRVSFAFYPCFYAKNLYFQMQFDLTSLIPKIGVFKLGRTTNYQAYSKSKAREESILIQKIFSVRQSNILKVVQHEIEKKPHAKNNHINTVATCKYLESQNKNA